MSSDSKNIVKLDQVCFRYPGATEGNYALSDISLDFKRGQVVGVIGNNGVGKSSLLKIIAGIIEPTSGRVLVNTDSISLLSLNLGFDQMLTGEENAILQGMLMGISKDRIYGALDKIKEYSGLQNSFYKQLKTYSTGMISRLSFSVTTVLESDLLLIDEVIGVGDNKFRKFAQSTFEENKEKRKTIIVVSHNLKFVDEISDVVVLLDNGILDKVGEGKEIIKYYRNNYGN